MASTKYWWECSGCRTQEDFRAGLLVNFLWDLAESRWNQEKLIRRCSGCNRDAFRITYDFPRADRIILQVIAIVGITGDEHYLPMMWETQSDANPEARWFDFKYVKGRRDKGANLGLKTPAVFEAHQLGSLFQLYCKKTGRICFP